MWSLLPNYAVLSSIGPCLIAKGKCYYPGFPQWLGKFSSSRKANRLIKELKQKMGDHTLANRFAIQNEVVPLLLDQILAYLGKGDVENLMKYLDDTGVSNEMVKEHLMPLSL